MGYTIEEKLVTKNEFTRPGTKLKAVKGIIIHWTANLGKGAGADAHYRYFQNNRERYASAHYFVDSGKILRIVPEDELCYHVGAKRYLTTYFGSYPNNSTIGVEMCVNPDGNFSETYKKSVWLCAHLLYKYKLDPSTDLARHNDITGKDCPRMFVDDEYGEKFMGMTAARAWAKFRADVKAAYNEMKNPTPAKPAPTKPATPQEVAELMSKYFKDVAASRWSADEIDKAKELGLMSGKTDTTFDPTGTVTREELAAVAVRIYEKLK